MLNKQSKGWWYKTQWCSLWRRCTTKRDQTNQHRDQWVDKNSHPFILNMCQNDLSPWSLSVVIVFQMSCKRRRVVLGKVEILCANINVRRSHVAYDANPAKVNIWNKELARLIAYDCCVYSICIYVYFIIVCISVRYMISVNNIPLCKAYKEHLFTSCDITGHVKQSHQHNKSVCKIAWTSWLFMNAIKYDTIFKPNWPACHEIWKP